MDFAVEIGRGAAETALDQLEAVPQLTRDVTDAYFDFWVDRIGDAASLAEPFDTGFVNAWVGQAIAGLTDVPTNGSFLRSVTGEDGDDSRALAATLTCSS